LPLLLVVPRPDHLRKKDWKMILMLWNSFLLGVRGNFLASIYSSSMVLTEAKFVSQLPS